MSAFKPILLAASTALALSFSFSFTAQADDTIVATVNGAPITADELTFAQRDLEAQFARIPEESRKAAALSALIEIRLLAQKGRADGLDKTPEFAAQLRLLEDRVLHQSVIDKEVTATLTDEVLRARYDEELAAQPGENEVKARHILVATKEEADAILAKLNDGGDFEALASENTTDPSGKTTGGDLGYFGRGMMVPAFEEAAFKLDPGTFTQEPVETQFGFHIIKVEDRRTKQPPAFDQVKDQIRSGMLRDRYVALAESTRADATIEYLDEELKAVLENEGAK